MSISDSLTDVQIQEQMADSLVAPLNGEGQQFSQEEGAEYTESDSGAEPGGQISDRDQINADLWDQAERIEQGSQQQPQEMESEAPQSVEVTPQAVQESVQQLEETVNNLGLNDPAEASLLASSLGVDPARSGPLGSVLAKTTLSALSVLEQCGGDLNQVGQIPREAAVAFSNDFMRAIGLDPRMSNANPEQLAGIVLHGTLSFLKAVETHGLNASLDVLNSPQAAEWFANALFQCFGSGERADRQYSLAIADAGGRYILSVLHRLNAQQPQQQPRQARQSQGRRAAPNRQRVSGTRFRSNADIFDEGLEAYQQQHGRL